MNAKEYYQPDNLRERLKQGAGFEEQILEALDEEGISASLTDNFDTYDIDISPELKIETKVRNYFSNQFDHQWVPVYKLNQLYRAYEQGEYQTYYLIKFKDGVWGYWIDTQHPFTFYVEPVRKGISTEASYNVPSNLFAQVESSTHLKEILESKSGVF